MRKRIKIDVGFVKKPSGFGKHYFCATRHGVSQNDPGQSVGAASDGLPNDAANLRKYGTTAIRMQPDMRLREVESCFATKARARGGPDPMAGFRLDRRLPRRRRSAEAVEMVEGQNEKDAPP
ncbi:hypothetical protein [Desulfolutivibrio sulfodismutans]|uniref:hypothetical protein n=1 Tax=Desulfolutivibrio sulfodismutans TaxID=63561 RepID=UPI00159D9B8F|nr:hypothetical protein [Desulfolutivibrio sulfodismutans]